MRARRKGTDKPYTRVDKIQLQDSDILFSADVMEFEPNSSEQGNPEQFKSDNAIDWEYYKIHAAIAAMQGTITILSSSDRYAFNDIVVEGYSGKEKTYPKEIAEFAVACADALIKEIKNNYGYN